MQLPGLLFVIVVAYFLYRYRASRRRRLPPGPRGYPLIGNIYDIPPREEWLWYKALSEKYQSDIVYFNMIGTPLIVVNTFQAADELFVKRSAIYSDRPRLAALNELLGWAWYFPFMKYGEAWKAHRTLFKQEFQPPALSKYNPQILDASRTFLQRLLASPDNFDSHLRHMAGTIILSIAYGINPLPSNDPYVVLSQRSIEGLVDGNASAFLVDYLPWIRYIPGDWGYKNEARIWKELADSAPRIPMEFVKASMKEGTAKPSIASKYLQEMQEEGTWTSEREELLRNVLGTMYIAGADTTVSSLETFILAMVLYPDVQKKGQAAVDAVTGKDRLPDFSDLLGTSTIPYIDAILKETLRWKQVTPLAVAHATTIEDEYNGYHIPAGSTIIGNAWAMLHDTTVYGPDPDVFRPERFMKDDNTLDPDVRDPDAAFGFGRRACAGQIMAQMSIWITIASMLASFDIVKAVDEKGEPIVPEEKFTSGFVCYPEPFECSIRPRSEVATDLITEGRLSEVL